jgi:hypothetical protein
MEVGYSEVKLRHPSSSEAKKWPSGAMRGSVKAVLVGNSHCELSRIQDKYSMFIYQILNSLCLITPLLYSGIVAAL